MVAKNKKNNKNESEDFDQFLKELNKATKDAGKEKKATPPVSADERRSKHKERHEAIEKAKNAEFERVIERQQQQKQLQQLLQQMMAANKPFLKAPNTEVATEEKKSDLFETASGAMQGWRSTMEDAHVTNLAFAADTAFCGVFDGHAGDKCSALCRVALPALAKKHYDTKKPDFGLTTAYAELDESLRTKVTDNSGSTAVAVIVDKEKIVCANVGDSRAVLCRGGKAVALSRDHKPDLPDECERIKQAGGTVENNRVNGNLAMSRAIGDYSYKDKPELSADKQKVIAVPEITTLSREPTDEFVVLACDGIFDVMSSEELVALVKQKFAEGMSLKATCESVCHGCVAQAENDVPAAPAGSDNMTITILKLL